MHIKRLLVFWVVSVVSFAGPPLTAQASPPPNLGSHIVLGWNDLGMHCMNQNYESLCILPPYNNLWAQVVRRGRQPQIIQSGVALNYLFVNNTYSTGKVNFWDYEDALFGVELPANTGLTGKGMTGTLDWNGHAFEATGTPLTPFEDDALQMERPYQLAEVTLRSDQGLFLTQTQFVAPVSVEMHCDSCHQEDNMTADEAILEEHDEVDGKSLLDMQPVLCASCHESNALGTPKQPGIPSLSRALHGKHRDRVPNDDCYACHPGEQTQCLRDVMFKAGMVCQDCHGSMGQVADSIGQGRRPWLDEPRCGDCHGELYEENPATLYRQSTGHGGMYCAACHNSPHAILPTVMEKDNIQAVRLQGVAAEIRDCRVCHVVNPSGAGPHGLRAATFVPDWDVYR
ncbi:hypothetical protein HQ520_16910 [bacterium]|nr:hypothetical protein [bacterium]